MYVDNPTSVHVPYADEKTVLSSTVIEPRSTIETNLKVTGTQAFWKNLAYIVIHFSPSNVMVQGTLKDPNGVKVMSNESDRPFVASFRPNNPGNYTLLVSNLGNVSVTADITFGRNPLLNVIAGYSMEIGIILVIGAAVMILRKKLRTNKQNVPR
ncbi:MAG: hypothetical protein WCF97_03020 [Nitrososphaeraceae archaeon]